MSIVNTIISGGQTGVDRAALDWAMRHGFEHGGWCPKGRRASDGVIPDCYLLMETASDGYRQRNKMNVLNSDATLILNIGDLDGGTLQTVRFAQTLQKPHIVCQLDSPDIQVLIAASKGWLQSIQPGRLNIAGPREEKRPGISDKVAAFLDGLFYLPPGRKN